MSIVVGFTYLDVCLGLGLRVVGENVDLNQEGLNSDSKNLFGAAKLVHIEMVYDYILKHIKVLCLEDFGKLYILLAISEFLLPNRSGTVFSILFNIVDDLGSIGKFNWGRVVYEYLVGSICEAKLFLKEKQSTKHFHVARCVYLLQVVYVKLISNSFDHFKIFGYEFWLIFITIVAVMVFWPFFDFEFKGLSAHDQVSQNLALDGNESRGQCN